MKLKSMTIPLLGLGLAVAPAFADRPGVAMERQNQPAMPGTVNYIEGSAAIDGQPISQNQVGAIGLAAGQELTTGAGKAEVLLTPGVFLRVGSNSAVKMIAPDLADTQVAVEKGRAGVEVDEIHHENNLQIVDAGVTTKLEKTGYYEFNAGQPDVMVFKGKADVELPNGKNKTVKGNHELLLAENGEPGAKLKTTGIDENRSQDDLLNWSRLRSQYLAEANNQIAGEYGGAGFYPGWYWDPGIFGYTYLGAGPFFSPFGWGFYPLGWGWGGWYGGGWYGGGPWYGPRYGGYHRFGDYHGQPGHAVRGSTGFRANGGGGFRGAAPAVGFQGSIGGSGFHSGMGGGGFHGGGGAHGGR
jgi:hypothetical protein